MIDDDYHFNLDAFTYYADGNTLEIATAPLVDPENSRPFVVRIGTPLSESTGTYVVTARVLVYATDAAEAETRVMVALRECAEKDYRGPPGTCDLEGRPFRMHNRAHWLLAELKKGTFTVDVRPFDVTRLLMANGYSL